MKALTTISSVVLLLLTGNNVMADMKMNDNPVTTMLYAQGIEYRDGIGNSNGGDQVVWDDVRLRIGRDLNKIELRSNGEASDGKVESANASLLYSRAVLPYWDLQIGWRHDFKPEPERDWFTVGLSGIAPYEFHSDLFLSVGKSGRLDLELEFERDYLITQRWVIAPRIEANLSSKDDFETGVGKGLTELELGLRLRYRISKKFAPYLGLNWIGHFGNTADLIELEGEETRRWQWSAGFTGWY